MISLRILRKFLWNFSKMLKSIFSLRTDPFPSIKIGRGGGVCTQAINLRLQKRIALLTLPVKNNLYTCNLSLGEYCNIPIFLSFLGSLLKQCILFGIVLQFSLPPPYTKLKGKNSEWTRVQHCLWGEGRGWTCVNWNLPQKRKSVPRLLSMIVGLVEAKGFRVPAAHAHPKSPKVTPHPLSGFRRSSHSTIQKNF